MSQPPDFGSFFITPGKKEKSEDGHADDGPEGHPVEDGGGEDRAHEGAGAGEGHYDHCQGHEECGDVAALIGLAVRLVGQARGQGYLERAEERHGEDEEEEGEDEVGYPVCADGVGGRGALEEGHDQAQQGVDDHDGEPEDDTLEDAGPPGAASADEKAHGHRYHREDAGGYHSGQSGQECYEQEAPEAAAAVSPVRICGWRRNALFHRGS